MSSSDARTSVGLLAGALAVFAITRLLVLFAFFPYVSDVLIYHEAAWQALEAGLRAYLDFEFPYPPLALALVYAPGLLSTELARYWRFFQLEMVAFDLLSVWLLLRVGRDRLELEPQRLRLAVYAYAILGLGVRQLLYDRLDLVIACAFLAMLWLVPNRPGRLVAGAAACWAGILVKLVPLFWAPWIWLAVPPSEREERWPRRFAQAALLVAPPVLALLAWNLATDGALLRSLSEHGERGIEIESVWATPIWIYRTFVSSESVPVVMRWGAHHLAEGVVSELYLLLSKYAGFALLALFYVWQGLRRPSLAYPRNFLGALTILFFLLASQRVLSPQYFVWTLPGVALLLAWRPRPGLFAGAALLYGLTFELFSRQYLRLVEGEPWPVIVLAVRNAVLVLFTVYLAIEFFRRPGATDRSAATATSAVVPTR